MASDLPKSSLWIYALPAIPMALPTLPVFILLPAFYHEQVGLPLEWIGLILLLARLVDGLSDFLAARLCDYPLGRLGRRHGWIVLGGLITAPGLIMLFNPIEGADALWLFCAVSLTYLGWTLIQVPYQAWIQVLSPDQSIRLSYSSARESAGIVGLLFSAALPVLFLQLGASEKQSFSWLGTMAILLGALSFALLFRLPKDFTHNAPRDHDQSPSFLSKDYWHSLIQYKAYLRLNMGWGFNGLGNGCATVLFPFVVSIGFDGSAEDRALFLLVYFVAALSVLPFLKPICSRFPRHKVWIFNMLIACAAFIALPFLGSDQKMIYLVICIITGFTLGADLALPPALQADLADEDYRQTGIDRPSFFFATQSLVTKLSLGISAALATALVGLSGSDPSDITGAQTIDRDHLLMAYSWLPIVFKLLACGCLWSFSLQRQDGFAIGTK